jgi:hypothetical protein
VADSLAVQLERIGAAIATIEGGMQSYTVSCNSFTKADLKLLYEREKSLSSAIARPARGAGLRIARGTPI